MSFRLIVFADDGFTDEYELTRLPVIDRVVFSAEEMERFEDERVISTAIRERG